MGEGGAGAEASSQAAQKENGMHVLVTVVILSVGFVTGYVVAVVVYDRVMLGA